MKVEFRSFQSRRRFSRDMDSVPRQEDVVVHDGFRYSVKLVEWRIPFKAGDPSVRIFLYDLGPDRV